MPSPLPPSQDWMVLECRACGTRMKSRREIALTSRILCPQCRTPVPVEGAGGRPDVEFRAELPEAAPRREREDSTLPPAGGRNVTMQGETQMGGPRARGELPVTRAHPVFDGSQVSPEAEEDPDVPAGMVKKRRKVRKKKRLFQPLRYKEVADWDSRELGEIPEAEVSADPWTDITPVPEDVFYEGEEREFVVEEVGEDGTVTRQIKRVRRRPIVRGAQLFFRRFTWLSRGLIYLLVALIVGTGIYGLYVLGRKFKDPEVTIVPEEKTEVDRGLLTSYDEQGAAQVIRAYLAADGIKEKLNFVRLPRRVEPLMERWYRGVRAEEAAAREGGEIAQIQKVNIDGHYYVMVDMPIMVPDPFNPGTSVEERTYFAVEEVRKGAESTYLVDWESTVAYQEMDLEAFKSEMSQEHHFFRVKMRESDYYNHGFSELDWQCVELYYPGRDFQLFGYIQRASSSARDLLPLVAGGARSAVILELSYPPDAASREQVIVHRLVRDSWFYDKDEPPDVRGK